VNWSQPRRVSKCLAETALKSHLRFQKHLIGLPMIQHR